MCGRVFRRHAGTPIKQVVQCQKTRWPILRTASAAEQYTWVDGSWRTLKVNGRIEEISHRTIRALAHCESQLPTFLVRARRERMRRLPFSMRANEE